MNRVTTVGISSGGLGYVQVLQEVSIMLDLFQLEYSTGKHVTGKITFNANGEITAVKIMNGGSAVVLHTLQLLALLQLPVMFKQLSM